MCVNYYNYNDSYNYNYFYHYHYQYYYYYYYYYLDPLATLRRIPATPILVVTVGLGTTVLDRKHDEIKSIQATSDAIVTVSKSMICKRKNLPTFQYGTSKKKKEISGIFHFC